MTLTEKVNQLLGSPATLNEFAEGLVPLVQQELIARGFNNARVRLYPADDTILFVTGTYLPAENYVTWEKSGRVTWYGRSRRPMGRLKQVATNVGAFCDLVADRNIDMRMK